MKRVLYWNSTPADSEKLKDENKSRTVMGAHLFGLEVTKALLRYSSYDSIVFPKEALATMTTGGALHVLEHAGNRVRWLPEHSLLDLQNEPWLIFGSGGPMMQHLTRLRRICGNTQAPVTGAIHSINEARMPRIIFTHLVLAPLHHFDALICESHAGRKAVEGYLDLLQEKLHAMDVTKLKHKLQLRMIPEGIFTSEIPERTSPTGDSNHAKDSKEGTITILYFGRLSAFSKADLQPLLYTFSRLHTVEPKVRLVIAGDDTQCSIAGDLADFACELEIAKEVEILPDPSSQTKQSLFAKADIFVSPADNLQETFGRTIVEAMAAGLPVVASDWNGYRDIVLHGETGFLVRTLFPPFGREFDLLQASGRMLAPDLLAATTVVDVQQLYDALLTLVSNSQLRLQMGQAGRRRARERFDWSVVIQQYEEMWADLHSEAESAPPVSGETLNLEGYPYRRVFGHYATCVLSGHEVLQVTPIRDSALESAILYRMANPKSWFSRDMFALLLDEARQLEDVTFSELVEIVRAKTGKEPLNIETHLARLIKYGVLTTFGNSPVPDESCETNLAETWHRSAPRRRLNLST